MFKPIKSTVKKALDYIRNPAKTDGKLLVSSFGCSYETADIEFEMTLKQAMQKGNNIAHHLIQSFEPGEATPELAHEIERQLAEDVLGGKYEYVLSTHTDKGHIHNHIIFCAVDMVEYKKYISNKTELRLYPAHQRQALPGKRPVRREAGPQQRQTSCPYPEAGAQGYFVVDRH